MTPKEALTNIAIAIVENFVGKDEPRRTEQINRFLNSNECQIIEQAFTELESLEEEVNDINYSKELLLDKLDEQKQILELMKNKPIHTSWFTFYETYEQYLEDLDNIDSYVDKNNMLTKEEFYLLKEYFNEK